MKDVAGSLEEQLGSLGVTSFGEVGDPFDPACHDALTHHVSAAADGVVCSAILRPGYRLGEHLLRPASVEVTGPAPPASSAPAARRGGHESCARPDKPPLPPALRPASVPSVRSDAISHSRRRSPADDGGGQDQPKDGGRRDGGRAPDLPLTRFATHRGKEPKRRVVAT
ncbi:nucleotide exchange factor GrpE [Streptomyces sp. SLBN-31]|uniref:nucleotide exchange factor GrpE n=1 Tax=Streptomyces sp. SLBN-31 TaxID=2768444 RepID=UPI0037DA437B